MIRHGTDTQPIRIDLRFIYARCGLYIHGYDINRESVQDRYDSDPRFIDDVN